MSESVPEAETFRAVNSSTVRLPGPVRLGALFTSFTVTLKVLVVLNGVWASSLTTTAIVYEPGPWASEGVQVMTPVAGLMVIPDGGEARLKVSVVAGSGSVAELVTVSVTNSFSV